MTITKSIVAAVSVVVLALAGCAENPEHTLRCTVERKLDDQVHTYDCGVLEAPDYEIFKQLTTETRYALTLQGDRIVAVEKLPSLHDRETR